MEKEQSLVAQHGGDIYQLMDALDDELIKAELENRIVNTWVYQFQADGRLQCGLSKVGVDACCTEMAKRGHIIEELELTCESDPGDSDFVLFSARAQRRLLSKEGSATLEPVFGTKRQWRKMKLRNGDIVDDPFWYEKGAMKALRNARSRLIPEEVRTKIITLAKQSGNVADVNVPPPKAPKHPETSPKTAPQGGGKKTITEKQGKRLWALAHAVGYQKEATETLVRSLLDIAKVEKTAELDKINYDIICDFLQALASDDSDAVVTYAGELADTHWSMALLDLLTGLGVIVDDDRDESESNPKFGWE